MRFITFLLGLLAFAWVVQFLMDLGTTTVDEPRVVAADRITPPGTELRVGQEAFVPYEDQWHDRQRSGIVAVTVTSVEPGDVDLFHETVENSDGFAPVYVRATIENVSEEDLGGAIFAGLGGVSAGEPSGAFLLDPNLTNRGIGDCRDRNFPDRAGNGVIIETCVIHVVREGQRAAGARWQPTDTPYQRDPIIWRL